MGGQWKGQSPIINRRANPHPQYDVGFNYTVGSKWPTKAWPLKKWKTLARILKNHYSISWQQGHRNILKYIDWIDNCKVIVTSDSLGQIVGHALGKKVISLFGPTNPSRMKGIHNITVISSSLRCPHKPCYLPVCRYDRFCMDSIAPERIAQVCERLLK